MSSSQPVELSDRDFDRFKTLFYDKLGIHLPDAKRTLVCTRLWKRLRATGLNCFNDYYKLITKEENAAELGIALELITTNETYFFREPKHFEFLENTVIASLKRDATLRIWSAACSSGEELYSIAMTLKHKIDNRWELLGSDINQSMLDKAHQAIYVDERTDKMPEEYRHLYCRKGIQQFEGCIRIEPALRSRVKLQRIELHQPLPEIGEFDVIFLRNVMIYFNNEIRKRVVDSIMSHIKPNGYLFVGHSESLRGIHPALKQLAPAIYQVQAA